MPRQVYDWDEELQSQDEQDHKRVVSRGWKYFKVFITCIFLYCLWAMVRYTR